METGAITFRARAKIAKGKFPLTSKTGPVVVSGGRLLLQKRDGSAIAELDVAA